MKKKMAAPHFQLYNVFRSSGKPEEAARELAEFQRFFFSSRSRHTSYIGDWSSDVCSSDLGFLLLMRLVGGRRRVLSWPQRLCLLVRSEERRVGKECRSRRSKYSQKKKL